MTSSGDDISYPYTCDFMRLEGKTKDVFVGMCLFDIEKPSEISKKVGMNQGNVIRILKQIEMRYGIVKRIGRGKYIVTDSFLKEWVRENYRH